MARLTARDAARLARAVNSEERRPKGGGVPARAARPNTTVAPKKLALVASGTTIPARSGGTAAITPGSGPATLYARTPTGWSTAGGIPTTIFNASLGDVVGPTVVQVGWLDGRWTIDVDDCPAP